MSYRTTDKRGYHVDSWMANGFYALLFKREAGLPWARRVEYSWTVHIYSDGASSDPTKTIHGKFGGRYAAMNARKHMEDLLLSRGYRVILAEGGKVRARAFYRSAEEIRQIAKKFAHAPASATLPTLYVAAEDIQTGQAVTIEGHLVKKAVANRVSYDAFMRKTLEDIAAGYGLGYKAVMGTHDEVHIVKKPKPTYAIRHRPRNARDRLPWVLLRDHVVVMRSETTAPLYALIRSRGVDGYGK